MKSTSHFAMAHILYAALKKHHIYLNRTAFVYGNIAPDYIPAMVLTPHFGKVCSRNVEELSQELAAIPLDASGRVGAEYSKRLGMVCHYLCDYFCFAHNREFLGGVRQHMAFENALDGYLRDNWGSLLELDGFDGMSRARACSALMRGLEAEKQDYISNGYSFESDLNCSFRACLSAVKAIVTISQLGFTSGAAPLEDSARRVRGFATGDCYVFRMFFFKNRNNNVFFMPELMPPIAS